MKNLLTPAQLEKMNTKRLLAYKKRLLKCHEQPASSSEVAKSSPAWQTTYDAVRAILATREHIEKKKK